MLLQITPLYAAALAILMIALIYHVILGRAKTDVSILHGEDMALATRIRRHGNFVEIVPMALLMMALAELSGVAPLVLHIAGLMLLVGRVMQPFGMHPEIAAKPTRIVGALLSHLSVAVCAVFIALTLL